MSLIKKMAMEIDYEQWAEIYEFFCGKTHYFNSGMKAVF